MADVSNVRPLAIFTGYMALAAGLTATSISVIRNGVATRRDRGASPCARRGTLCVFGLLAIASLAVTWYHMFCFFRWSYSEWLGSRTSGSADELLLGEWLRDTKLFKQAWGSTLETAPRAWWSLQIFGFCANLSVMLAVQEQKRLIPHMWAFMLLGQIVAISFASNMFFLAVLVYDCVVSEERADKPRQSGQSLIARASLASPWYDPIVIVTIGLAVNVPSTFGQAHFMSLLLAPHLLAFLPLVLNRVLRGETRASALNKPDLAISVGSMAAIVSFATYGVFAEGRDVQTIIKTLHEHPAVSSVGWDVVCCWVSYTAWLVLGEE